MNPEFHGEGRLNANPSAGIYRHFTLDKQNPSSCLLENRDEPCEHKIWGTGCAAAVLSRDKYTTCKGPKHN